jgi:alpha-L-fucosidase
MSVAARTSLVRRLACVLIFSTILGVVASHRVLAEDQAGSQHKIIGVDIKNSAGNAAKTADTQWFSDAGLGLFVHWGLSSVDGHHDLSWGMMGKYKWTPHPLTPDAYWALADRFDPQDYNPEKWLQAAKDAGFGYAVLTTRHHDGYALWPSAYGDFSTRTHMAGRDLLRFYVEACRKVGIKVGFYYSPPDWHYHRQYMSFGYATKGTPDSPHLGTRHEPVTLPKKPADFDDKYVAYVNGQITELMTRYGKIDILWFDGGAGKKMLSQDRIRAMQPGILINDRGHGKGDIRTGYECVLPTKRPEGCWEHCFGLTSCWGYQVGNENEDAQHLAQQLLVHLVKCRDWGGNALANCGPRPSGDMPVSYYRCMDIVKTWIAARRESVVGVQAGPYPEKSNVPVTVRGKTWYLHLLPKTSEGPAFEGTIVLSEVGKPRRVVLLGGGEGIEVKQDGATLSITVPKKLRTSLVDVVAVEW